MEQKQTVTDGRQLIVVDEFFGGCAEMRHVGDGKASAEVERRIEEVLAGARFPRLPHDAWAVFPVSFPLTKQ